MFEVQMVGDAGANEREGPRTVLERARAGDPDALHAIFNRYSRPVLSFVYHMLGDYGLAEEATQETFARAFMRMDTMKADAKFSTWIFGIARNVVREAIKDKYRRRPTLDLESEASRRLSDPAPSPDAEVLAGELQNTIRGALEQLNEDQKLVFILKVFRNMPYAEISGITGSSIGKLKTDLHRARLEIRRHLLPYLGEPYSVSGGEP